MTESAGILLYRKTAGVVEVLLAQPGGPLLKKYGWWIPKGFSEEGEDLLTAAYREFEEEMGLPVPEGTPLTLGEAINSGKKMVAIWAVEGDYDIAKFKSNTFTMEWPPRSGIIQEYPENDQAAWLEIGVAAGMIFASQLIFLERLAEALDVQITTPEQQTLL